MGPTVMKHKQGPDQICQEDILENMHIRGFTKDGQACFQQQKEALLENGSCDMMQIACLHVWGTSIWTSALGQCTSQAASGPRP